jgi:hypothetical protein
MDDQHEKFNQPADEGEEVEGHKFIQDEAKPEKFVEPPADEDDEVEAHKF